MMIDVVWNDLVMVLLGDGRIRRVVAAAAAAAEAE
jgi:hypothetical protein